MKVQTIQHRINRFAFRLLAIGTVLMGFASSQATAQTPLLNYLSTPTGANDDDAASGVRQVSHEGRAFHVVDAGAVKTAGDLRGPIGSAIAGQRPVQSRRPVRQTSCNACNSGSCNGSCGSYSGYSSYSMDQYSGGMACGTPCQPYCYGVMEMMGLQRGGDRGVVFTGKGGRLKQFDLVGGARFTIGSLPDCVHGCEATFVGVFDWERYGRQVDPAGGLVSVFSASDLLDVSALRPFNEGAVDQRQLWEAEYWSIEGNKTLVGWDLAKILFGFRYLEYNEAFEFRSLNLANEAGRLVSRVDNRLAGVQVGLDLLYPIGRNMFTDFRSRAGVYANFAESAVQLANSFDGNVIANFDESTELAGVIEVGSGYRFQLGEMLAIRAGFDFLYMPGIGKAPSQIPSLITPFIGRNVRAGDDVFMYGLSVGAELRL